MRSNVLKKGSTMLKYFYSVNTLTPNTFIMPPMSPESVYWNFLYTKNSYYFLHMPEKERRELS